MSVLGQPLNRYEGRLKVTGTADYSVDRVFPRMMHAVGVTSTIAHGEIVDLDDAAAREAPGVLAVLHPGNVSAPPRCPDDVSVSEQRQPFEDHRIYYAGQFIALVVAETFEQARYASRLIKVRYREDEPVLSLQEGARRHGLQADEEDAGETRGDPAKAYDSAEVQLEAVYTTPVETHQAMELHSVVAQWDGPRLVVHDSTQWVVGQKQALARTFQIPEEDVVVVSRFIGGGFGGKLFLWPHTVLAAMAARMVKRPVKLSLDRRSEFTTAGHRPATSQRIRIGATRSGELVSLRHHSLSHTSVVHEYLESCTDVTRSLYRCKNVGTGQRMVPVHVGTPTPMRGPGETPGLWALESALDELAVALAIDPLTLRLRNLPERDDGKDRPWSSHTHGECLRRAAERFGWSDRDPTVGSMEDRGDILGWGLASATWPGHRDECRMRVDVCSDGIIRVVCATQDIGTGTYTVLAQVVSEITGYPFDRIEVTIGDSRLPEGPISGGSMATATVVPAVADALRRAVANLAQLAVRADGPMKGTHVADLCLRADGLARKDGGTALPVTEILAAAGLPCVSGEAHTKPGEGYDEYSTRSFGAHCVEVRWDPTLARLRVSRVVSVLDTGRIINRKTAENQVYGSIVMGLGMALLEQSVYDPRNGRVITDNLADYLLPVQADIPDMDVTLLDRPDPQMGEFGARGIGEIGLTGIAAAIANAVYHATGRRIRDLPITIEKLV